MFVRIEVANRPEFPDPGARILLHRIQTHDPELRARIRWARLLEVYWLEIPRAREEIIPACQEIFLDRATQWLFTGNLIPSASGKQGELDDLLEASPIRPGKFWGLERRFRPGVSDSKAFAVMESLRMVLGEPLAGAEVSTGQLLVLEGASLREEEVSRLAREIWCNPATETWSFLPERELLGNDRFFQERFRREESGRGATSAFSSTPTLQSFARGFASTRVAAGLGAGGTASGADVDWNSVPRESRGARLRELAPVLGRELSLSELDALLEHLASPGAVGTRTALGLPANPTRAELQLVAAAWSEEAGTSAWSSSFSVPDGAEEPDVASSLLSRTLGATVQQIPKSWIVSAGDHRPAILALDENLWISFGLRNSVSAAARDSYEPTLQLLLGAQREVLGGEWPALPLAQSHLRSFAEDAGEKPRVGLIAAVESSTRSAQVPILAGAEGSLQRGARVRAQGTATLGVVVRKTRATVRPGDRVFIVAARGESGVAALEPLENAELQRRCLDALAEVEAAGIATAIRSGGGLSPIPAALRLALEAGGMEADAAVLLRRGEPFLLVAPPAAAPTLQLKLAAWGLEPVSCGEFQDSGNLRLKRGAATVGELPLRMLWNPPLPSLITVAGAPDQGGARPRAPEHAPFDKEGDRMLLELLGSDPVRSPLPLIRASDLEAQALTELKPLSVGGAGTRSSNFGPNDGTVVLVGPQLIGLSEDAEGQGHELALGVGLWQRESMPDSRWLAESALDEAVRNCVAVGGNPCAGDAVAGIGVQWFGPRVEEDPRAAAELVAAMEGLRDAAMALELPVLSSVASFSSGIERGFAACHSIAKLVARGRSRGADFKYAGDLIYVLGPEARSLAGSRFAERHGCADPASRRPVPNWSEARRIYSWLGGARGKEQGRLRSLHDISDGGMLAAVAEGCLARSLGAHLRMPDGFLPEAWAFAEGFHRFVVTCGEADAAVLEAEWDAAQIAWTRVGTVTAVDRLEIAGFWSVKVAELRRAWQDGGVR